MPDATETSEKVPSPLLWNSRFVSVGSPLGPQLTGTPFQTQLGPVPTSAAVWRSNRR